MEEDRKKELTKELYGEVKKEAWGWCSVHNIKYPAGEGCPQCATSSKK